MNTPPQIQRGPEIKQVAGMSGSLIRVELEQDGWVLMTKTNNRLPLVSRTTTNAGNTSFSLRGQEPGRYELEFGRQTSFGFDKRVVLVQVSPYQQSVAPAVVPNPEESRVRETQVSDLGAFIQTKPQAKELAGRRDDLRNQQERLGLEELHTAFNILMTEPETSPLGVEMGAIFSQRFFRHDYTPGVLFRMAQFLESQGDDRNLQQAYTYYERVFNEFPINPLSRRSRERMDHLDRFFLRIH